MSKLTHWDYCQFLLVSQVNYTQTYFADHSEQFSHDRINRLMRAAKLTPRELRQLSASIHWRGHKMKWQQAKRFI